MTVEGGEWAAPSWLVTGGVTAGIIGGLVSIFILLIKMIGPWRKQITEEEAMFRATLIAENRALRRRIARVERALRRKDAIQSAERQRSRHKVANLVSCLEAGIHMLEMNPDRSLEVVAKIKQMRETHAAAEAEEAGIIRAAEIAAAGVDDDFEDELDGLEQEA